MRSGVTAGVGGRGGTLESTRNRATGAAGSSDATGARRP